jgi:hypothetical protein
MRRFGWLLYGLFLTMMVSVSLKDLWAQGSSLLTFYTILIALEPISVILLTLNIFTILLGILAPMVVLLYASNIQTSASLWRILFWVRLFFDAVGHHYDTLFIKSAFYQSSFFGLASIVVFFFPLIPSYIVHYRYAFKAQLQSKA